MATRQVSIENKTNETAQEELRQIFESVKAYKTKFALTFKLIFERAKTEGSFEEIEILQNFDESEWDFNNCKKNIVKRYFIHGDFSESDIYQIIVEILSDLLGEILEPIDIIEKELQPLADWFIIISTFRREFYEDYLESYKSKMSCATKFESDFLQLAEETDWDFNTSKEYLYSKFQRKDSRESAMNALIKLFSDNIKLPKNDAEDLEIAEDRKNNSRFGEYTLPDDPQPFDYQ